jgi:hypothetical protein
MRTMLTTGLILLALAHPAARADATLHYRLTPPAGEPASLRMDISGFFARIESTAAPDGWWLFQAGKFFPLYRVDDAADTWTRLTPKVTPRLGPASRGASPASAAAAQQAAGESAPAETAAMPADETPQQQTAAEAATAADPAAGHPAQQTSPGPASTQTPSEARAPVAPKFAPTAAMDEVAGVRCRVVTELRDGETVMEHCMASKAALGITERETRTLARTFAMAREQGFGWLGTATADEEFVSVRSRAPDSGAALVLETVSTAALPRERLRVPRAYAELPRESTAAGARNAPAESAPAAGGDTAPTDGASAD